MDIWTYSIYFCFILLFDIIICILLYVCRRTLFDAYPDDPDYTPPPEDRPGGFNWGQGAML